MSESARGLFVTFEGPEGGGKSTQAAGLAQRLTDEGVGVVQTREPGGTPVGEAVRSLLQHDAVGEDLKPEAELLLFEASRAQLVREVILPALAGGKVVISDRFADSTTAYQGYGRGEPIEPLLAINDYAIAAAIPDLTLLLDIDTPSGRARISSRYGDDDGGRDRFEREEMEFHERVRHGYLDLAARWPDRFRVIDGSRDIETVSGEVWGHVQNALAARGAGGSNS